MSEVEQMAGVPEVLGPDYTFERRFGRHCPFCGEPWSSRKTCGEGPGSWIEQNEERLERSVDEES